jgi:hypothetical protein
MASCSRTRAACARFRLSDGTVLGTALTGGMITVARGHVVGTPFSGELRVPTPTG